ncbi:hypothetical protein H113_02422 [Trichophyton rubrum MR1459]|uniref:Uncharacterized protein n=1 Tax=Trichophyton rubrum (strain ATCC MYA-4607 / CBS 118892) TaxID=559305 RepID=A0A080WPG4_TRIRC|nr:uncharacterized protein TERG_12376 [Trichophyton rubrum CBS 118892]EZF97618.1 hypothetical protein H113_02422 [Trichophyton rubrum MR1459]EZG08538.1 hypothetical protein H106_02276 [Trichophyton rubrum CBS 735.88]KFL62205.1 hypothetical protein TERG_12376 [Trichophyton rubrum CBS 118892]
MPARRFVSTRFLSYCIMMSLVSLLLELSKMLWPSRLSPSPSLLLCPLLHAENRVETRNHFHKLYNTHVILKSLHKHSYFLSRTVVLQGYKYRLKGRKRQRDSSYRALEQRQSA